MKSKERCFLSVSVLCTALSQSLNDREEGRATVICPASGGRQMFGLGFPELMVVLIIALVLFGPSKLPTLGKSLGEAIRGFKKGLEDEPPKEKEKIEEK